MSRVWVFMTTNRKRIDEHAAEWAVRLSSGPLSADAQAEFDSWLNADIRHRGALLRVQAAWLDVDRLVALAGSLSEAGPSAVEPPSARESPASYPTRRWVLAAGLSALTAGSLSMGWWLWRRRDEVYESGIGEVRRITLPDGSSMVLNTATRARVRFTDSRRHVDLIQGEAVFDVSKDQLRPFVVLTRNVSVRAVGTVFAVRAVESDIAVTVTEGVVEVAPSTEVNLTRPQKVLADERAVVRNAQVVAVQSVSPAQIQRQQAWQDGLLSFDGELLSEAVAEINRHNVRQVQIDDVALGSRPVVGVFRASDIDGFAQAVAVALSADSMLENEIIHLRTQSVQ